MRGLLFLQTLLISYICIHGRPTDTFESRLSKLEETLETIFEDAEKEIQAELGTENIDLNKLPDDYDNSTTEVEDVNGNKIVTNKTISKHKGKNGSSSQFSETKTLNGKNKFGVEKISYGGFDLGDDDIMHQIEEKLTRDLQYEPEYYETPNIMERRGWSEPLQDDELEFLENGPFI